MAILPLSMWKIRTVALGLLLAGIAIGFFVYDSQVHQAGRFGKFPFTLGLDLKGGVHLVYKADVSKLTPSDVGPAMASLRNVVERRINVFGVSEPVVQVERSGFANASREERLIVELPGITDLEQAVALIGKTPVLEFKLLKQNAKLPEGGTTTPESFNALFMDTGLTGSLLDRATVQFDSKTGVPLVSLRFNNEGRDLFAKITREHVGQVLAIFLDGQPISMPVIQEEIRQGEAQITGRFTAQEAKDLVRDLNYGALPVPIELVSTASIGASLGDQAVDASVKAGLLGFLVVGLFLLFWYRLPGLIAVIALALYVIISLALFKFIPVTLTAAGLAAFILSLGMAVDANILIFERTKEELKAGRSLEAAIREGFSRAWLSIRDSNLSSIITGVILFWLGGTAVIKGFAFVFVLGVVVSMFTAITVTRTLLLALPFRGEGSIAKFLFSNGFSR